MGAFTKLLKSKSMKTLKPFVEYVLGVYYSGVDTVSYTHLTLPTNREV